MQIVPRVLREQQSYDDGKVFAANSRVHSTFRHVFECPNTRFCERYIHDQICGRAEDAYVLDYGCGKGAYSVQVLRAGAKHVVGIDISPRNIEEAEMTCREATGPQNKAEFHVMDAHHLLFPDQVFDLVIGGAILHHLEFQTAIHELARVLKKGGYAIFAEPLRGNPAASIYRALTRDAHTPDELPLSRKQIEWANSLFESHHHVFGGFLSTALGLATSLTLKDADNPWLRFADSIDQRVMHTPLRYWMRYVYLVWKK